MSITLDTVTFTNYLVWTDRYKYQEIPGTVYEGMDGTENVYVGQRGGHYPVTLESASKNSGWVKGSELDDLIELARDRDATYTLSGVGDDKTVRFRHEVSGGPIQMTLVIPTGDQGDDTNYYGKIYLMCTG